MTLLWKICYVFTLIIYGWECKVIEIIVHKILVLCLCIICGNIFTSDCTLILQVHNTVNGDDKKFDFNSVSISDESLLRKSIAPGETITITFDVTLDITSQLCTG